MATTFTVQENTENKEIEKQDCETLVDREILISF